MTTDVVNNSETRTVEVTSAASAEIAAMQRHVLALEHHYGPDNDYVVRARSSLLASLAHMLGSSWLSPLRITRDGAEGTLSLQCVAGYGRSHPLVFGLVFHREYPPCVHCGSGLTLIDDRVVMAHWSPGHPHRFCAHEPARPWDWPDPGEWSLHS